MISDVQENVTKLNSPNLKCEIIYRIFGKNVTNYSRNPEPPGFSLNATKDTKNRSMLRSKTFWETFGAKQLPSCNPMVPATSPQGEAVEDMVPMKY